MTDEVKNEALESDGRRRVKIGEDAKGCGLWFTGKGMPGVTRAENVEGEEGLGPSGGRQRAEEERSTGGAGKCEEEGEEGSKVLNE